MKHPIASILALALAVGFATTPASAAVTPDWVTIGNPGNATQSAANRAATYSNGAAATTMDTIGDVAYTYRMARNKTTIAEYTEFLNAKAKLAGTATFTANSVVYTLDTHRLWNPNMQININTGVITRSGTGTVGDPYTYQYSIITRTGDNLTPETAYVYTTIVGGGGDRPIAWVDWFAAARFANWIQNGQGAGGDTETGAYTLTGIYDVDNSTNREVPDRNPGATVFVPTMHERYKAANYDPNWGGPGVGGYWLLGNKSNTLPTNLTGNDVGQPYAVNCRAGDWALTPNNNTQDFGMNYLTDVGAYGTGSQSAYGCNDMMGLLWEWTDTAGSGADANRPARKGGSWLATVGSQLYDTRTSGSYSATTLTSNSANREDPYVGFRIAASALDHFAISAIASPQAVGTPITGITITAQDVNNNTYTDFTGTVTFGGTAGVTGTSASFVAGVLSGFNFTPTVSGSNLTLTVTDGASHNGSTTIATINPGGGGPTYASWSGGAAANVDTNKDGVLNACAWALGAANPAVNAIGLLPTLDDTTDVDFYIFSFNRGNDAEADTGTTITVEYGSDLTGWTTAVAGPDIIITEGAAGPTTTPVEVKIRRTLVEGRFFARLNVVTP